MTESFEITSVKNPLIIAASKLRQAKARKETGNFGVEGVREIGRALANGYRVDQVFVCESLLDDEANGLLKTLSNGTKPKKVSKPVFAKLCMRSDSEGLFFVFKEKHTHLTEFAGHKAGELKLLVLDRLEKPGNIGALIRTAAACGVDAVILSDTTGDLYNPNLIRSSLGYCFILPVVLTTSENTQAFLADHKVEVYVAALEGKSRDFKQTTYAKRCALVLGSEAKGVGDSWLSEQFHSIFIPMANPVDSLNVSVSGGILMYECFA